MVDPETVTSEKQEFYMMAVVYGGVVLTGMLVSTVLLAFVLRVRSINKSKSIIKKIYEEPRSNGKSGEHH